MKEHRLKCVTEAALLAAGRPLSVDALIALLEAGEAPPTRDEVRAALEALADDYSGRGIELKQVASGYRVQVRAEFGPLITGLWAERPPRYSRALLETLALIAYRQPITRAEIEDIRGVGVSTSIMKTLLERGWARVVGHRDVPGKPAMYGTTRDFLDHFNLKSLAELPTLAELRDLDTVTAEFFDTASVSESPPAAAQVPLAEEEGEAAPAAGAETEPPSEERAEGSGGPHTQVS